MSGKTSQSHIKRNIYNWIKTIPPLADSSKLDAPLPATDTHHGSSGST